MDPISFAAGIIGLWSTCRDGYSFVASVCSATSELAELAISITIEGAKVSSWGQLWGLHGNHDVSSAELQNFLDLDAARKLGTYLLLSNLSRKFADAKGLEDSFGIRFDASTRGITKKDVSVALADFAQRKDSDEVAVFNKLGLQAWKERMGLFKRCKWAATSKSKVKALLEALRTDADNLLQICPTVHRKLLYQGVANIILVTEKAELKAFIDAANRGAQEGGAQQKSIYKDLGAAAKLRATIEEGKNTEQSFSGPPMLQAERYSKERLGAAWMTASRVAHNATSCTIDYLEWKSITRPRSHIGVVDDEMETQVLGLGRLLCAQPRPRNLRMLTCKGIFKDSESQRYGIVYQLPKHLQHVGKQLVEGQLDRRLPTNLARLLAQPIRDLGYRFDLARKLVESVIAMHASGWLHKNIQPNSILFFPIISTTGDGPRSTGEMDYEQPYLMGCNFSRPSDEVHDGVVPSRETVDHNAIELTPYQHPDKVTDPKIRYRHSYDVHSLGIVLLELGLWEIIDKSRFPSDTRARIEKFVELSHRLKGSCGNIYARCVRQCLEMETLTKKDLVGDKSLQKLCWSIAKDLALCRA